MRADHTMELFRALQEIRNLIGCAGQDKVCAAVAEANKNQAWHIANRLLIKIECAETIA